MPPQAQTYTVKGGDNLFSIAGNIYGNQRMFAEIMRLNGLTSGVIRPGMVLRLPMPKPNAAINITQGLMNSMDAENKFVREKGYIPSQQELGNYIANGTQSNAFFGGKLSFPTPDYSKPAYPTSGTVESLMKYKSPATTTTQPSAGVPSGYTSAMTPEAAAAYGNRYNPNIPDVPAKTRLGVIGQNIAMDFAKPSTEQQRLAEWVLAGAAYGTAVGGPIGGLVGAGLPLASYGIGKAAENIGPWLNEPYRDVARQQAQKQAAIDAWNKQNQPVQPIQPQRNLPKQIYTVTFDTSTPNIPKTNLQPQQLPDPTAGTPTNDSLLQLGMTQDQANLFSKAFTSDLSIPEANQYRFVFNVQPNSPLDNMLNQITIGAPSTNDQTMNSIWTELQNTGGFGMPTEWITRGGGGGGGGRGRPSGYSTGGSATYGGF